MDITQIIITVGVVIAALFVLWAVIAGLFAVAAKRSFDKTAAQFGREHEDFRKRNNFPSF